ncbi:uncharacterized protein BT62DRAFT_970713 [Guyanagaster necrorhizus]|uniref:Wax synthase domain-containing protein n=1 Tax=Guyanagaster necrorhizus TaxID=856835 RepID=A0A9P7VRR7_9AGAR|nr:uncharacterized protein BT62DRAFT_970713 [Guyanagaster necrorhizus MCA 3950]KAG7444776.1 hypothetical protein BT62DRAFT_970713 [Guyanagaster necrorhizus MCA 3950]
MDAKFWKGAWMRLTSLSFPPIPPDARSALTTRTFLTTLLPSFLSYYLAARLAINSRALSTRIAFLPIALYTTYKCATTLDLAPGEENARNRYFNDVLVLSMTLCSSRIIVWTFSPTPPRRLDPSLPSSALQLCLSLRGYGWNWGPPQSRAPQEWRPTSSVMRFVTATVLSVIFHTILYDLVLIQIECIAPGTWQSPWGTPILPPSGYPNLQTTAISFLSFFLIYASVQIIYDVSTLVGVGLFQQPPSKWPPLYDNVLLSTSLAQFWGHRYHQLFRQTFAGPFSLLPLPVIVQLFGAFVISGLFHCFGTWAIGNGADWWPMGGFFVVNALGIGLERVWSYLFGRKVGGLAGKVWTVLWLAGWGNWLFDEYSRKGMVYQRILLKF